MSDESENEQTSKVPEKSSTEQDKVITSLLRPEVEYEKKSKSNDFDEFVDERILISNDIFRKKEMKIKVLEISDEHSSSNWKFGERVKINKILVTIRHLENSNIEESEFDIEAIEKELAGKRNYSSTNRWMPIKEIKKGYVLSSRHTQLISDASALDYIDF
jgi:hypothetical protein